jgi:hypothetical protein
MLILEKNFNDDINSIQITTLSKFFVFKLYSCFNEKIL